MKNLFDPPPPNDDSFGFDEKRVDRVWKTVGVIMAVVAAAWMFREAGWLPGLGRVVVQPVNAEPRSHAGGFQAPVPTPAAGTTVRARTGETTPAADVDSGSVGRLR